MSSSGDDLFTRDDPIFENKELLEINHSPRRDELSVETTRLWNSRMPPTPPFSARVRAISLSMEKLGLENRSVPNISPNSFVRVAKEEGVTAKFALRRLCTG